MHTDKLLFLDFDGVLHSVVANKHELFCRVHLLNSFLCTQCCEVVISSSWRLHFNLEELKERLPRPLANLIVGQTGSREIGPWPRFAEIKNYIIKHKPHANWRALDDAIVDFPINCPQLIRCDPNVGLTTKEITALSNWLGGDRPPTASLHRLNF